MKSKLLKNGEDVGFHTKSGHDLKVARELIKNIVNNNKSQWSAGDASTYK